MANNETKIVISANTQQAEGAIRTLGESLSSTSKKFLEFSGIAGTLAGALSVGAFAAFVKSSVDAATQYQNALNGLASTARYAGEDIAATLTKSAALTADGMLSTTEAATALKNLLSRGFSSDQAIQMITRLKDSAAFGRQASLQFGEAVVTATEGLKNENSVLVDNAGVTKNVSVMWKEYAATIGTTADKLTMAQKRAAEYNGVLKETEGQIGNAALAANGMEGATARMNKALNDSAIMMGQTFTPAAVEVVTGLSSLAKGFGDIVNPIAKLMQNIGTGAAEMVAQVGLAIKFFTEPSLWSDEGARAKLQAQFDSYSKIADESRAAIDAKFGINNTPQIGNDTGVRRSDVNTPVKATAKSDPIATSYLSAIKQANDLYDASVGKLNQLNEAQISLLKVQNSPIWAKYSEQQKENIKIQFDLAGAAQDNAKALKDAADIAIAKEAAIQKLATTERAYARDIAGMGIGDQFRSNQSGLGKLEDTRLVETQKLESELRTNKITKEQYAIYLGIVNDTYKKEVDLYTQRTANIEAKQKEWTVGANDAFRNYLSTISNTAKQTEQLFTNAFKGMEDALVKFVRTGKLDFTSLADQIINDMIRIQIQQSITKPLTAVLSGGIGSLVSGLFNTGSNAAGPVNATGTQMTYAPNANGNTFGNNGVIPFANGGIFDTATPFKFANGGSFSNGVMGEAGPEAVMPLTRGANGKLGVVASGGGSLVVQNTFAPVINAAPGTDINGVLTAIRQLMPQFIAENQRTVLGAVNQALTSRGQNPIRA